MHCGHSVSAVRPFVVGLVRSTKVEMLVEPFCFVCNAATLCVQCGHMEAGRCRHMSFVQRNPPSVTSEALVLTTESKELLPYVECAMRSPCVCSAAISRECRAVHRN